MTELPAADNTRLHTSLDGLLNDDLARLKLCGVDVGLVIGRYSTFSLGSSGPGTEYLTSTGVKIYIPAARV